MFLPPFCFLRIFLIEITLRQFELVCWQSLTLGLQSHSGKHRPELAFPIELRHLSFFQDSIRSFCIFSHILLLFFLELFVLYLNLFRVVSTHIWFEWTLLQLIGFKGLNPLLLFMLIVFKTIKNFTVRQFHLFLRLLDAWFESGSLEFLFVLLSHDFRLIIGPFFGIDLLSVLHSLTNGHSTGWPIWLLFRRFQTKNFRISSLTKGLRSHCVVICPFNISFHSS